MDAIPIISQGKSVVQFMCGDKPGAKNTQKKFLKQCPGFSQGVSLAQWIADDKDGALETQKECFLGIYSVAQSIPVVGHGLGLGHHIFNDSEGRDQAFKSASRSSGTFIGALVGGVPGALLGGALMDSVITLADSAVHDEFRPSGNMKLLESYNDPGVWYDCIGGTILDGYGGKTAHKTFNGHLSEGMSVMDAVVESTINRAKPTVKKVLLKKAYKTNKRKDSD